MYNRLIKYLDKIKCLYHKQFGFRSNHSTIHALLVITDKIQRAIENSMYSCGVFLDLSKAFDTVNHNILLSKLQSLGIRSIALDWFRSYLSNRKQFVSIGNANPAQRNISCRLPQGSVLGPLLFLLYVNDFSNCSKILDFHIFSDDSNLFYAHKSLENLVQITNDELQKVNDWLCANKLSLNVDKSNFAIFHSHEKQLIMK